MFTFSLLKARHTLRNSGVGRSQSSVGSLLGRGREVALCGCENSQKMARGLLGFQMNRTWSVSTALWGFTLPQNSAFILIMGEVVEIWENNCLPERLWWQPFEFWIIRQVLRCAANPAGHIWSVNVLSVRSFIKQAEGYKKHPSQSTLAHGKENFAFKVI